MRHVPPHKIPVGVKVAELERGRVRILVTTPFHVRGSEPL